MAATTHTDLLRDLNPSVHIHKRFGKEILVNHYPNQSAKQCSLVREMQITEGTTEDWRRLAGFHYRSHKIAAPRKIFCLNRGDELCGVIAYCYPPPTCFGRRLVLPKMSMKELNEKLSIISRVVVHPKYRTIGLGVAQVLQKLGFNIQLLGSQKYILQKLQTLKHEQLKHVRKAFITHKHVRFLKGFFPHKPYGETKLLKTKIMKADCLSLLN